MDQYCYLRTLIIRLMSKIFSKYKDIHYLFWVFTLAVLVIAILPSLVQDGMFIDGTQYAVVSKNLANGLGTFWFPHISQNWNIMGSNVFLPSAVGRVINPSITCTPME